jgi:hypothetical protein
MPDLLLVAPLNSNLKELGTPLNAKSQARVALRLGIQVRFKLSG